MLIISSKNNYTVVRNAAYRSGEFNLRERHNERKNESYHNGDIDINRADMNIHFHKNYSPAGEPETYEQTFNRLLEEGKIVKRGLKPDAKVFDELVFDVNTAYFEENGGYDFAKSFFEEAYRCAVKEVGGEDYILSAVLHADERNKALSEELGRDVYHYHLHVVYVPVVQKEIKWSKRTKDKSLIGKVKEVIPQISHSKKWPMRVQVERDGKTVTLNSYSLLQDRFYQHMREAGFEGFERGVRGSTREHLSELDYKIQQDDKRLAEKQKLLQQQKNEIQHQQIQLQHNESQLASAGTELAKKEKEIYELDKSLKAVQGKVLSSKQIEKIPVKISRPIIGGADNDSVTLSKKDWDNVKKTVLTQTRKDEE